MHGGQSRVGRGGVARIARRRATSGSQTSRLGRALCPVPRLGAHQRRLPAGDRSVQILALDIGADILPALALGRKAAQCAHARGGTGLLLPARPAGVHDLLRGHSRDSTTFSAPVSAGRANTSYASMMSSSGNRWVTSGRRRAGRPPASEQRRGGVGVDQAGRDRDVADPQVFQVQGGRLAVHADVGDPAARPDQGRAQFEGRRRADGLDDHVGAQAVGERARSASAGRRPA